MNSRNIVQRVERFNSQRPEKLRQSKYKKMKADPFSFFRGSCHLFHEDWPVGTKIDRAPQIFICGDLHLENFGTYKGADSFATCQTIAQTHSGNCLAGRVKGDRQVYFGINDFDEGMYAPLTRDVTRLAVSILLVGKVLGLEKADRSALATNLLDNYRQTLLTGRHHNLKEAEGIVGDLLVKSADRSRLDLLKKYLGDVDSDKLQEKADKILAISDSRRDQVLAVYYEWAKQQSKPDFYECLDIKQRLAGLGSLGVDRYLLLVAGRGKQQRYLLDLKEQLALFVGQPAWSSAQRVLTVQSLRQSPLPALSGELLIEKKSFTLRELQPSQDKITCDAESISKNDLQQLVQTVGQVTAWSHLRTDKLGELLDYAAGDEWCSIVLEYATKYAKQVKADHREFTLEQSSTQSQHPSPAV
jgi:uncharacterized protein (DUF2252 family)